MDFIKYTLFSMLRLKSYLTQQVIGPIKRFSHMDQFARFPGVARDENYPDSKHL